LSKQRPGREQQRRPPANLERSQRQVGEEEFGPGAPQVGSDLAFVESAAEGGIGQQQVKAG
jgi:hypothetical protein